MAAKPKKISRDSAIELLTNLVSIPSLSRQEAEAAGWLVAQMRSLGYDKAYVDEAGNAVGEMGSAKASARTVVLLGHIDTVPGDIPVRVEEEEHGEALYGRGTVDAKGPLATATVAVARLGSDWARKNNIRLVVVGAVEEEAATSKGARFIRDRFNGKQEPIPKACIIGEPSTWHRVSYAYKGRVLIEIKASQPMMHTAGPDAGIATVATDFWTWMSYKKVQFNEENFKLFEQFIPNVRSINTWTDEEMQDHVSMKVGIRLPLDYNIQQLVSSCVVWSANHVTVDPAEIEVSPSRTIPKEPIVIPGDQTTIELQFTSYEPAWKSERDNALFRSFLAAIRQAKPGVRPSFVSKTGTSDMNVVGPAWKCPILAYGPGNAILDHTPNEHVYLDEYWQAVMILENALQNLARSL